MRVDRLVDLREAEVAPDDRLSGRTLFDGIDITTPSGRRIESCVKAAPPFGYFLAFFACRFSFSVF
jgi:hypothetical protein